MKLWKEALFKRLLSKKFQSHSEMNMMVVSLAVFEECVVLYSIFVVCELFQQMSNAFDEIHDKILGLSWYRFPTEINRMLPTILMITQQPVEFKCFGSIACSRDTLKKV